MQSLGWKSQPPGWLVQYLILVTHGDIFGSFNPSPSASIPRIHTSGIWVPIRILDTFLCGGENHIDVSIDSDLQAGAIFSDVLLAH